MNKLLLLLFILFFVNFVNAECFPNYQCGEWGECDEEGLKSRVCVDNKCGAKDILERDLCGDSDCDPDISCGEWSSCNFFDKTNDILKEELRFEGSKERICVDKSGCINSFIETEGCSLAVPIKVKKTEWCGQELIEIFDSAGNIVGRIQEKEIIKNFKRVDIFLVEQNIPTYCSYCFDREKNYDEEKIDCGGASCPRCIDVIDFIDWAYFVSIFTWGIFILIFFIGLVLIGRRENFNDCLKNIFVFFKPLSREEALAREEKIKQFIAPKKISSEGFKNY